MVLDLPFFALIDTTVFLRRLGEQPDDPEAPACKDFCDRMVRERRQLYVAAPTITEVTRKRGFDLPRTPGISVVAFDERAATGLGKILPIDLLKSTRDAEGRELNHVKYDALIIGCALRIPGCTFVSLDAGQIALAIRCGLAAHRPSEYHGPRTEKTPTQGSLLSGITP